LAPGGSFTGVLLEFLQQAKKLRMHRDPGFVCVKDRVA
jgi:hypothetical protein